MFYFTLDTVSDLATKNRAALEAQPLDYERPGLAQHYCVECAKYASAFFVGSQVIRLTIFIRYYETDHALKSHWRSKVHKRRLKELKEPAYTIEEAERAAGLGRETKRPATTAPPGKSEDVDM